MVRREPSARSRPASAPRSHRLPVPACPPIDATRAMDASTIERDVLEQLLRVAECDAAAIVRLGAPEHARIPLVDALIVGDATITERSTRLIREGGEWRPLAFARRHADSERLLSLADVARLMGPETFRTSNSPRGQDSASKDTIRGGRRAGRQQRRGAARISRWAAVARRTRIRRQPACDGSRRRLWCARKRRRVRPRRPRSPRSV